MHPTLSDLISRSSERWKHCEGLEETTLLRLAILRDLVRGVHSAKSRSLATGKKDDAKALKGTEQKIEHLRGSAPLEGDLVEILEGKKVLKKRTRLIPSALFTYIDKEKFERYDRQWENAMAAESCAVGWKFWALEAWVEVQQIEPWNQRFEEMLWPNGIVLYSESAHPKGVPDIQMMPSGGEAWFGRWIVVFHPRFQSPEEQSLNFSKWPGSPSQPPAPARWKMLFSPKKR